MSAVDICHQLGCPASEYFSQIGGNPSLYETGCVREPLFLLIAETEMPTFVFFLTSAS